MGILKTNDAWTGPDKVKHVAYMAGGTFLAAIAFGVVPAIFLGAAIAVGKEVVYDYHMGKGTPSAQDLVASFVGLGIGVVVHQLLASLTN